LTAAGARVVRRMASWSRVREEVRTLRVQIEPLAHTSSVAPYLPMLNARLEARLEALHRLVWTPLASVFERCTPITLVARGELGAVPFAALRDGALWLGDRHRFAAAPGASAALHALRSKPVSPQRALIFGESTRRPHAANEAHAVARCFARADTFV